MRNFKMWFAYQFHDWLFKLLPAAIIQIIVATIIELANTLWLGKSVYPSANGPQIMNMISVIYMIDAGISFIYFVFAAVSWYLNRYT